MSLPEAATHRDRMMSLLKYTASSLTTKFPSPFGSAIYDIQSGVLVAEAYDTVIEKSDPTDHAEMNAIRLATRKLQKLSLSDHILYSTCEPCPMCMSAILWAELDTVVYGASTMEDANKYWPQASDLTPTDLVLRMRRDPKCVVVPNVERSECQKLFLQCDKVLKQRKLKLPPNR